MNKSLALFLALLLPTSQLSASTFYVSSTGSDSNNGTSLATAWLTVSHAFQNWVCGSTLLVDVIADIAGDGDVPYCAGNALNTVQSLKWGNGWSPVNRYRTNPANDSANYGKLLLTSQGIQVYSEVHGNNFLGPVNAFYACVIATSDGTNITIFCNDTSSCSRCANGVQVSFYPTLDNTGAQTNPVNINQLQKYWLVGCSGSTCQISTTQGGSAITGITCTSTCSWNNINVAFPLQVNLSTNTITEINYSLSSNWTNGIPISFASTAAQSFGTLPAPLQLDTQYYSCAKSGNSFKVATDAGCTQIVTLTTIGSGPLTVSDNRIPSNWAFRGLEIHAANNIDGYLFLGAATNSSALYGPTNFEVDHSYLHQDAASTTPSVKGIYENAAKVWIHDSWIGGFSNSSGGDGNAINWCGSPGPTQLDDNFIEASGENTIAGGCGSTGGLTNQYKTFTGNYLYKPPTWKVTVNSGAAHTPTGACWYDNFDPSYTGGEWYLDSTAQWYRCQSNHTWATTGSTPYGCAGGTQVCGNPFFKNIVEHKNGANFTYVGNLFQYSWVQAQDGEVANFSAESGSGPGMANANIIFSNNAVYNIYTEFSRESACGVGSLTCPQPTTGHVTTNNLFVIDANSCGVNQVSNAGIDCTAVNRPFLNRPIVVLTTGTDLNAHNLTWTPDTGLASLGLILAASSPNGGCSFPPPLWGVTHKNNIQSGDYGGDCFGGASGNIGAYYNFSHFQYQAIKTSVTFAGFGTSTFNNYQTVANNTAIGFNGADGSANPLLYALTSASPFSAANGSATQLSDDGTDLGPDIQLIAMKTSNVKEGMPNWDVLAHLFVDVGSTAVVFRYTAPTSAACTATIYNLPARISANQVASVADSAATSVQNGLDRNLLITSGMTAATGPYYYKLDCGGGIVMVGSFTTRAAGSGTTNFPFAFGQATAMQYSATLSGGALVSPTVLAAATTQPIPVTHGTPMYAQVGTTGPITIVAAP